MPDTAHQLLGRYKTPRFRYGAVLMCDVRGFLEVVGLTDGRIPWPVGKPRRGRGKSLIVFGDLAKALRRESVSAICYWWSVSTQTVSKWRRELGVSQMTEGTTLLKATSARESPALDAARVRSTLKARDPERCRKIAEARRGKRRPPHVIEAMRQGRINTPVSEEARKKLSEANRRRGTRPPKAGRPWSKTEDDWVRQLPAPEVAAKTGRSLQAVYDRRQVLGVPDGRRKPVAPS